MKGLTTRFDKSLRSLKTKLQEIDENGSLSHRTPEQFDLNEADLEGDAGVAKLKRKLADIDRSLYEKDKTLLDQESQLMELTNTVSEM